MADTRKVQAAVNMLPEAVSFDEGNLTVSLSDGRKISVPLAWFPRLLHGTPEQRAQWEMSGGGEGLHWEALNEDISISGLLAGRGDQTRRRKAVA